MRRTPWFALLVFTCSFLAGCGGHATFGAHNASVGNQTANNTSAANSFPSQSNGNLGANNVSKVNLHTLLYPGATTKILAQYLLWFGQSNHMNVGYNSNDATQVQRQVTDMISRGIDGVII